MLRKNILSAAIFFAALFLYVNPVNCQTLLLLNSGSDYCLIYSVNKKKVLSKYRVCEKKASCTDIVPLNKGFLVVPHRLDLNVDATELIVYNKDFSSVIKKITVAQSPYRAFMLGKNMVLINHTFFSFSLKKFVAEIVDLNKLKVVKTLYFDGIPSAVTYLFGKPYAVVEDVRGVIGGIKLVNLEDGSSIFINNENLSSNIYAFNGFLYCAVNSYGKEGYADSLFKIEVSPIVSVVSSAKKVFQFQKGSFPFILGSYNDFLVIGFTNHSVKNNLNKVCFYNTQTRETVFFNSCFGPETMAVSGDKIFIAGISSESITEISPLKKKSVTIKISDAVPGFSRVRILKN